LSSYFSMPALIPTLDQIVTETGMDVLAHTRWNHAPVAQDQTMTTDEGVSVEIILSAVDKEGDPLTYQIIAPPTNGTLSGVLPKLTYNPAPNYSGPDNFTFKANDGKADSNIATVSITVRKSIPSLNLTITSPQDGAIVNASPVLVSGNVCNNATVMVNGVQAPVTQDAFSVSIPLSEGFNTVTALATDSYGQSASKSIQVTLITRGAIQGMVADSSTGLPLISALVSITDSQNNTKTALTESSGRYAIPDLAAGAFSGNISKEGYNPYPFSGTLPPGQTVIIDATLTPILPLISNILVRDITTDSAKITWTTDMPADSLVEYGPTPAYGSSVSDSTLATSHEVMIQDLTAATEYHFRVISRNVYGFVSSSGDYTFTTQAVTNPLTLTITSPPDGATITRPDVMVKGTVINAQGYETGVVVNGVVTNIYGNEFVASHIPLVEGSNTITATATDVQGNKVTASVTVNAAPAKDYIRMRASSEVRIGPFETILTLDSSLDLTNASVSYQGAGEVELIKSDAREYRVTIQAEGIYTFTARVSDSSGNVYEDRIDIIAMSKAELENRMVSKWEGMKEALFAGRYGRSAGVFRLWSPRSIPEGIRGAWE